MSEESAQSLKWFIGVAVVVLVTLCLIDIGILNSIIREAGKVRQEMGIGFASESQGSGRVRVDGNRATGLRFADLGGDAGMAEEADHPEGSGTVWPEVPGDPESGN